MIFHIQIPNKKIVVLAILSIFILGEINGQIIEGYIKDAESYEPLVGATLFIEEIDKGVLSNNFGYFSFGSQELDTLTLHVRFLGYTPFDTVLMTNPKGIYQFYLNISSDIMLPSAEIIGSRTIRGEHLSTISIPIDELKSIPALFGEPDPLKALSLLPGVTTGSEGSSGLYIRGGTPDQNLILFDGAKIYNTNHLFGFLSPFNPGIIKAIDVYKDGFPAHFGGRLSSIIDITGLSGNKQEFKGEYSVGLLNSKLNLQGPIKKGKLSYLFGARLANLGLITAINKWQYKLENLNEYQTYLFYDLNGKIDLQNEKSNLSLSIYDGKDDWGVAERLFNGEQLTNIDWGNRTLSLNYNLTPGKGISINSLVAYNHYQYGIEEIQRKESEEEEVVTSRSYVEELSVKVKAQVPWKKNLLTFGYEGGILEAQAREITFSENVNLPFSDEDDLINRITNQNLFIENQANWDKFRLVAGIRWAYFIASTQQYSFIEPRVSLSYYPDETSSFRISYTKMNQPIHLLNTISTGVPSDVWILATDDIPPQFSSQFSLGYEKQLSTSIFFATQIFYKEFSSLIDFRRGVNFFLPAEGEIVDQIVLNGLGNAFGIEFFLRKKVGKLTGWLAYTLSRSQVKFNGINDGKWYNRRYDRPHDLSITALYNWSDKWSVAANFILQSGFMYTLPEAAHIGIDRKNTVFSYGDRNNFRAPSYQRLDISAEKKWQSPSGKKTSLSLGVYNVLARRNPFYIQADFNGAFQQNETSGLFEQINIRPTITQKSFLNFIPYVSYSREF